MPQFISIKQMLSYMATGDLFSISYVTFDKQRKKGGRIEEFVQARLLMPKANRTDTMHGVENDQEASSAVASTKVGRPLTAHEQNLQIIAQANSDTARKPNHSQHHTRNIQIFQEGKPTSLIRKVHYPLVLTFNDAVVVA